MLDKLSKLSEKSGSKYFAYTILFFIFSFFLFSWKLTDYTTITDGDNFVQHYKAFVYYGDFLRNAISFLVHGLSPVISQFDINIGEGSDIIQSLCYYVVGDPLSLLSVFFNHESSIRGFAFVSFLRLYLVGFSFVFMCLRLNRRNFFAVVAGAIFYTFSLYSSMNVSGQTIFLIPMYMMPFLISGVNDVFDNKKPYLYVFTVFFSALSNFYFFYMMVLTLIAYAVVKAVLAYKKDYVKMLVFFARCILFAVISCLLAAFLLFPILNSFLSDDRAGSFSIKLLYDLKDYVKLPDYYFENFSILILLSVFMLISDKRKIFSTPYVATVICLLVQFIPLLSQVLNGMSYPGNRWFFILYLVFAYVFVVQFEELMFFSIKKTLFLIGFFILYSISLKNYIPASFLTIQCVTGVLFAIFLFGKIKNRFFRNKIIMYLVLSVFSVASFFVFLHRHNIKFYTMKKEDVSQTLFESSAGLVKKAAEKNNVSSFYRYTQTENRDSWLSLNSSIFGGPSSTQYYWSLSNCDVLKFRNSLEICDQRHDFMYFGYDFRPVLLSLANVQFIFYDLNQNPPSFYKFIKDDPNIFINESFMPLGYTYDKYVLANDFSKLNGVEKENILSKACVLEKVPEYVDDLKSYEDNFQCISFSKKYSEDEIRLENNSIATLKKGSSLIIDFDSFENKNIFIRFSDMDFISSGKNYKWQTIRLKTNTGYQKQFDVELKDYEYDHGLETYTINLGYSTKNNPINSIEITFDDEGCYLFKDFQVFVQDTDLLNNQLKSLSADHLKNVEFKKNAFSGRIFLSQNKILCVSIPYLKGWKAFVDGKPADILKTNIMYMGLEISPGEHFVQFVYETPFLRMGCFISLLGMFVLFIVIFFNRLKALIRKVKESQNK